MYISFC